MKPLEPTPEFRSPFLRDLQERGSVAQCTDAAALDELMLAGPVTAYVGFDATADSLHVGHLVLLMAMRRLASAGHEVIALIGGATTMVGDPSFRNAARPMLQPADVASNAASIRRNIEAVAGPFSGRVRFVDNAEWLGEARLIDFMRSVGSHFTVARMLAMESVSARLEAGHPLTMLEFSYMMLQAADFLELSRRHGCVLQMGGSDQWGNIVNGIELARRSDGRRLFGLTTPLLANAAGEKMGKTAGGAVWLSADRLPPSGFWQFWRNVDDADVGRFLALFTDLPMDRVREIAAGTGEALNGAKAALADAVTTIVHGEAAAGAARAEAESLFGSGAPTVVTHEVDAGKDGIGLLDLIVAVGFARTKGDARRLVRGGAVRVGGEAVHDERAWIAPRSDPVAVVAGRKNRALVRLLIAA